MKKITTKHILIFLAVATGAYLIYRYFFKKESAIGSTNADKILTGNGGGSAPVVSDGPMVVSPVIPPVVQVLPQTNTPIIQVTPNPPQVTPPVISVTPPPVVTPNTPQVSPPVIAVNPPVVSPPIIKAPAVSADPLSTPVISSVNNSGSFLSVLKKKGNLAWQ